MLHSEGKIKKSILKKRISLYSKKISHLIETNIGIYKKTNKRGKVFFFSQHIFRGVTVKCAKQVFSSVGYAFDSRNFLEGRLRHR